MKRALVLALVLALAAGCWTGHADPVSVPTMHVRAARPMRSKDCAEWLASLRELTEQPPTDDSCESLDPVDYWYCMFDGHRGRVSSFEWTSAQVVDACAPEAPPLEMEPDE